MDKAREKTDKILLHTEKDIGRVYATSSALSASKKKLSDYMKSVQKATESLYRAYINESDISVKEEKKKRYMNEIKAYTTDSKEYKALIREYVEAITQANQQACDVVNESMYEIYAINYNQFAVDCRKAGIKVNGEE